MQITPDRVAEIRASLVAQRDRGQALHQQAIGALSMLNEIERLLATPEQKKDDSSAAKGSLEKSKPA